MGLLTLLLITGSGCDRSKEPVLIERPLEAVANQLIIPWHAAFALATKQLHERLERFCQNPANPGEYQEARDAWRASFLAWQPVNLLHFGPLQDENLQRHIYFWPDEFNWLEKKLNNRLIDHTGNNEAAAPGDLGLAEIEFILFNGAFTDSAALAGKPCDLLRSASSQMQTRANELLTHWQSGTQGAWQAQALAPGSSAEASARAQLASSLSASFTRMTQEKLIAPIGSLNAPTAKPQLSEAWRANLGKTALLTELQSANALWHMGLSPFLTAPEQKTLGRQLKEDLNQLSAQLTSTPGELVYLINTEQGRSLMIRAAEHLQILTRTFSNLFIPANSLPTPDTNTPEVNTHNP